MKMQIEYITPDRASEMLANQIANRPIKTAHVDRLVRAVLTGNFKLSPFPVVLDKVGKLVDGQHRLTACVTSGSVLPFWVAKLDDGENPLDIRMQSSASVAPTNSDLLAFERPADKNHVIRASIAKFAFHMESGLPMNRSIGYHEVRDVLDRHAVEVEYAVDLTMKSPLRRLTPTCFGGTLLWLTTPKLASGVKIQAEILQFAERYVSGESLRSDAPEMTLRNYMLAGTVERRHDRLSFVSKFCSLLVSSMKGEKRDRANGSRGATQELAKLLGKTVPPWIPTSR